MNMIDNGIFISQVQTFLPQCEFLAIDLKYRFFTLKYRFFTPNLEEDWP
jgi:hypothetical protein